MSSSKIITLKSCDGVTFEVEEAVALESKTIKFMIEDGCAENGIPIPNVTGNTLAKVIEYCKMHVEAAANSEDVKDWDAEFVKVDRGMFFKLVLAANYLNIKSLADLTCKTMADEIKRKIPEEVRTNLRIKNDYTAEEEEEIRRENH